MGSRCPQREMICSAKLFPAHPCLQATLTLWHLMATLVDALCDAERTKRSLKPSAKNAHSYGYPFKSSLAEYKGYVIPAPKDECYPSPFLSSILVFLKRFLH